MLKYEQAAGYRLMRAAVEATPDPKLIEALPGRKRHEVRLKWARNTQSDLLVTSGEAVKLADVVPSVEVGPDKKMIPLLNHLAISYAERIQYSYPGSGDEGSAEQIHPHVGDFLENYLKGQPADNFYLFGLGLGSGYHSILIVARRTSEGKTIYLILDNHMNNAYRISSVNADSSLTMASGAGRSGSVFKLTQTAS